MVAVMIFFVEMTLMLFQSFFVLIAIVQIAIDEKDYRKKMLLARCSLHSHNISIGVKIENIFYLEHI